MMPDEASRTILVRCACGWEAQGTEEIVIEATLEHGRRIHNMVATRDEVLAMAVDTDPGSWDTSKRP